MRPEWAGRRRVLLRGGIVHSPTSPFASAMLLDGDVIAWLGDDAAADVYADAADEVVDLGGRLVTPGFVDGHVHTTSTGLLLDGLDLQGARSLTEALDRVRVFVRTRSPSVVIGHGWNETEWPEGRPPTAEELDRATGGAACYLSRIDVHSAVVSSALLDIARDHDGFDASGWVRRAAHHAVREHALGSLEPSQVRAAQRAARYRAASLGIVAFHEMGGPVISSADDFTGVLALSSSEPGPVVFGHWGEHADHDGIAHARSLGAIAAGGDLFVDGAIGSRTACMHDPYTDAPGETGALYLDEDAVHRHVGACLDAGVRPGFHVIGDRASEVVLAAVERIAAERGTDAVRQGGVRLEHVELLDDVHIAALARLGIVASMQPMFDALWGGPAGMYEGRLGADRAHGMNRCADLARAGVLVAFGSDAPVTELGPWQAIRAAVLHNQREQRMSARAAFAAHSRAGWRSIGVVDAGVLAPGQAAHLVVWDTREVVVQVEDDRVRNWSTDPRSATPGLPELAADVALPRAERTYVAGSVVFDSGALG